MCSKCFAEFSAVENLPSEALFFDRASAEFDNGGPRIMLSEACRSAEVNQESLGFVQNTGWHQVRTQQELEAGATEFKVRIDRVGNKEIVVGFVTPEATQECYCLHSCTPADGVFVWYVGFDADLQSGDVLTVRIDFDAGCAVLEHNGEALEGKAPFEELPGRVVPVVELYAHKMPKITIVDSES
eukprot:TRINITY_DN20607_c0_g1_i1.p1 TRINITY_DN20607_c0_g1~~TRINITY_DN20607_c0_g1_i1.p1  ORF type:complete len:185 (+),score=37.73 TRINITY_DN20607_c0_g1_i1:170-724(+)